MKSHHMALSSSGGVFTYSCGGTCTCTGCAALGYYCYESYRRPANGGACGCGVEPGEGDGSEQDDEPYDGGASVSFSKRAVIFEDRYENTPGVWVERQSTKTKLHCIAHGGPNGGHVRFEMVGEDKLERVSGNCTFPFESDVGAGKKIDFKIEYSGKLDWVGGDVLPVGDVSVAAKETRSWRAVYTFAEHSVSEDDVQATATFTENLSGEEMTDTNSMTVVMLRVVADEMWPTNKERRVFGVGEEASIYKTPNISTEAEAELT